MAHLNDEQRLNLAAQLEVVYPEMSVSQIVLDAMASASQLWEHPQFAGEYDSATAMVIARGVVVEIMRKMNAIQVDALCRRN